MLTLTVLVMLSADEARLVPANPSNPPFELMSRKELRVAYDLLDAKRPGLVLPIGLMGLGLGAAIALTVAFWSMFSTPYGLAIYAAVLMIAAFVVTLGMIAGGIALFIRNRPERDELGRQMEEIETALRQGRCRTVKGLKPCPRDPAPPFVPQVSAPGPQPSFVLAAF